MLAKTLSAMAAIGLVVAAGSAHAQYAAQQPQTGLWNQTVPVNGAHGEWESPNALPPGFTDNTQPGQHAQNVARWFTAHGYKDAQVPSY